MKKLNRTQKIIYLIIIILLFGVFVYVSKNDGKTTVTGRGYQYQKNVGTVGTPKNYSNVRGNEKK